MHQISFSPLPIPHPLDTYGACSKDLGGIDTPDYPDPDSQNDTYKITNIAGRIKSKMR